MTNIDSIAAKVRALLSKTVENGATEAEAMMAMKKAGDIMAKHNLTMSEIELRDIEYVTSMIDTGRCGSNAMKFVVQAIADFCDCQVYRGRHFGKGGKKRTVHYYFFGSETDTLIAEYFFDLVQNSMDVESAKFKKTDVYAAAEFRSGGRRRASNSFEIGFAARIAERLRDMKRGQTEGTGTDLIVLKAQLVEDAFNKEGPKLSTTKTTTPYNPGSFAQGDAAGRKVALNTGMAQRKPSVKGHIS